MEGKHVMKLLMPLVRKKKSWRNACQCPNFLLMQENKVDRCDEQLSASTDFEGNLNFPQY